MVLMYDRREVGFELIYNAADNDTIYQLRCSYLTLKGASFVIERQRLLRFHLGEAFQGSFHILLQSVKDLPSLPGF